jgi:phage host-nuclease inhibitor protein Gam
MGDIDFFDDEAPVQQGFTIDSPEKAEWAGRMIAKARALIQAREDVATILKARIDAKLAAITAQSRKTIEDMTLLLRPFAETELATQGGKKRSVDLLCGRLGFRQSPARLEVDDEAAALAWLEANASDIMIRTKKEVKKADVKKAIEAGGAVPDGVRLVPGEVNFYVETDQAMLEGGKA